MISKKQARRIALHSQLLDGRTKLTAGIDGVAQVVNKLGYVQIDTISVIERAHNHTLWVRQSDYKLEFIDQLLAHERRIFEYWGHALSYLPIEDYRFYLPRMKMAREDRNSWEKEWYKRFGKYIDPVRERIMIEGPLSSKDLETTGKTKGGGWWDCKPAKGAMELLFWRGELMISARRKFERIYDLTDRVLPPHVDRRYPDDDELGRFLVKRALNSYGMATLNEIVDHIRVADRKVIGAALQKMLEEKEVVTLEIDGIAGADYFVHSENIDRLLKLRPVKPKLHILSPFDNLIIQRERTARLFDFDYTLECYTPPAKRKYGYFVLPILWGETLVGRLDPKADRKNKTLLIKKLILENGFKPGNNFYRTLGMKLQKMAGFNKCETIKIETAVPAAAKRELQRYF